MKYQISTNASREKLVFPILSEAEILFYLNSTIKQTSPGNCSGLNIYFKFVEE